MKSFAVATLLAAAVLAVPTTDLTEGTYSSAGLQVRNVGYQGDGFYLALFDDAGSATVEFTPFSELNLPEGHDAADIDAATSELVTRATLNKRGSSSCSNRIGNSADMDKANIQLAQNANGRFYGQHAWGWTFYGEAASYFCNYQAQTLTYSKIIEFHTWVSNDCGGSSRMGFHRCTNDCGINDLSVGRTFRGDHFCDCCFTGL